MKRSSITQAMRRTVAVKQAPKRALEHSLERVPGQKPGECSNDRSSGRSSENQAGAYDIGAAPSRPVPYPENNPSRPARPDPFYLGVIERLNGSSFGAAFAPAREPAHTCAHTRPCR